MAESLKSKTMAGVIWTLLEKIGTQVVSFVVSLFLARILTPADYGVVGLLYVFIVISQLFVDCGFTNALIQKKDRSDDDFSTVFWFNLGISVLLYCVLFVIAPCVAAYYKIPQLTSLLRALGLTLILNSLYAVQVTRLTASLNFKLQAKIAVFPLMGSGVIGIGMACAGFGPWALISQALSAGVINNLIYWPSTKWTPKLIFSVASFSRLFKFGSRLLGASIINQIYQNIGPLIVGRKYTVADLGYYSRSEGLVGLPIGIFNGTLGKVIFPVLAEVQDDDERLRNAYLRYLRVITSLVVPMMLLISAVAEPLIIFLIGEKWIPAAPYLRVLCVGFMVEPFSTVGLSVLYVKGRSDTVLKLEFIKKAIAISLIVVAVQYGVLWLCVARAVYGYIAMAINFSAAKPYLKMGVVKQILDVLPIYLGGGLLFVTGYATSRCIQIPILAVFSGCVIGSAVYLAVAWVFRFDVVIEARNIVSKVRRKGTR